METRAQGAATCLCEAAEPRVSSKMLEPVAEQPVRRYQVIRRTEGAVLATDVRGSSRIIEFVEKHHGPAVAADVFMSFIAGSVQEIDRSGAHVFTASGDAVLAEFTGPDRVAEAADAARRAVRFVHGEFSDEIRPFLRCDGLCGDNACPRELSFEIGAGIDDGVITASRLVSGHLANEELIGRCVSIAAKISGGVRSPHPIGITWEAYERGQLAKHRTANWLERSFMIADRRRLIMVSG